MLGRSEAGDTLVEVLIATAILGMAVVGALSAMSFGQGIALNAIERTTVQGLMNSQLSYVRYARDMKIQSKLAPLPLWDDLVVRASGAAVPTAICNGSRPMFRSNMFYIKDFTTIAPPQVVNYPMAGGGVPKSAATVPSPGDGMWIEAVSGGTAPTAYIDFYVKACWSPSSGTTMQESRTVMRLYVPS